MKTLLHNCFNFQDFNFSIFQRLALQTDFGPSWTFITKIVWFGESLEIEILKVKNTYKKELFQTNWKIQPHKTLKLYFMSRKQEKWKPLHYLFIDALIGYFYLLHSLFKSQSESSNTFKRKINYEKFRTLYLPLRTKLRLFRDFCHSFKTTFASILDMTNDVMGKSNLDGGLNLSAFPFVHWDYFSKE